MSEIQNHPDYCKVWELTPRQLVEACEALRLEASGGPPVNSIVLSVWEVARGDIDFALRVIDTHLPDVACGIARLWIMKLRNQNTQLFGETK